MVGVRSMAGVMLRFVLAETSVEGPMILDGVSVVC